MLETRCVYLRGRRNADDERWDAGAAEVEQPALGQQDHALAVRPDDVVHLRAHTLPRQLLRAQAALKHAHTVTMSAWQQCAAAC